MSEADRLAYLAAMGIQVWESRDTAPAGAVQAVMPGPAPPPAGGGAGRGRGGGARPGGAGPAAGRAPPPAGGGAAGLDWDELEAQVGSCTRCVLHATRTRAVFGVGDPNADLLLVGEAPGADEDRQGEPFVGRAGKLLNEMLHAIGYQRRQVYIANILKCRPPNNRDPQPAEVECCEPYLHRQVQLLRPKLIVALGRIAAQNLLGTHDSLARLRGRHHVYGEEAIPVVVTYHPAYLLRSPREKRKAWEDLQYVRKCIEAH